MSSEEQEIGTVVAMATHLLLVNVVCRCRLLDALNVAKLLEDRATKLLKESLALETLRDFADMRL